MQQTPTRIRYGVLCFVCTLSMITYLDRVCIASAASHIVRDLHLQSIGDLKWAFSAFGLAYALFEVPSGWLGDVFGPRKVLLRIVLWWSICTALTGAIGLTLGGWVLGGIGALTVLRFLFGMGEAGAYPNITRVLHDWLPFEKRGFAQGMVWMAGRLTGGLTPFLWMLLVEGIGSARAEGGVSIELEFFLPPLLHWRAVFLLFGVIGVVWCVCFMFRFHNRPEDNCRVNAAEIALIRSSLPPSPAAPARVPWTGLLSSPNLWAICLMYACQSFGWYFYISYLPECLSSQFGVPASSVLGAVYKGGPLWLGAIGCLLGGFLTDWLIRRTGNRKWGRRGMGVLGHFLTGCCFLLCPLATSAWQFFLVISCAGFFTDLTMGAAWATCQDVGKRHAAIVAGFMNMTGNIGGAIAAWLSGSVLERALISHADRLGLAVGSLSSAAKATGLSSGYRVIFLLSAAVYAIGVACWLIIDSTKPIESDTENSELFAGRNDTRVLISQVDADPDAPTAR